MTEVIRGGLTNSKAFVLRADGLLFVFSIFMVECSDWIRWNFVVFSPGCLAEPLSDDVNRSQFALSYLRTNCGMPGRISDSDDLQHVRSGDPTSARSELENQQDYGFEPPQRGAKRVFCFQHTRQVTADGLPARLIWEGYKYLGTVLWQFMAREWQFV